MSTAPKAKIKTSVKPEAKTENKKSETTKTKKEEKAPKKIDNSYGVKYLTEQLGLEPFTVRQKLRAAKTKKNGKTYSWEKKADADAVVKTLKATKLKNEK